MSTNHVRRGSVLRHRALRSDGVYRVLRRSGATVEVEVIDAPGLAPGMRVRLSDAAALAMDRRGAGGLLGRALHAATIVGRAVLGHMPQPKLPAAS